MTANTNTTGGNTTRSLLGGNPTTAESLARIATALEQLVQTIAQDININVGGTD